MRLPVTLDYNVLSTLQSEEQRMRKVKKRKRRQHFSRMLTAYTLFFLPEVLINEHFIDVEGNF